MKILFLYTELAGYVVSCINKAVLDKDIEEIHVVRYPINPEAPFQFSFLPQVKVYERENYSTSELLRLTNEINPSLIVCSGWVDKGYLRVCKSFNGKVNTVLTLDNHWSGTLKQQVLRLIAPWFLKRRFTQCWVPGTPQKEYALKLSFKSQEIQTGFYSIDLETFSMVSKHELPKRFLCVARYISVKGWEYLWEAYKMLQEKHNSEWELWCAGTGEDFEERVEYPGIKHLGFLQPEELQDVMKDTTVFVLPSLFEPWGVVVQEFAAAGFPMLLSEKVGSKDAFLEDNKNGYVFESQNSHQLYECLLKMTQKTDLELFEMGKQSQFKAKKCDTASWINSLKGFVS